VLGIERVGIHDDFFALGGHSLLATKVISRIRDQFSTGLPLKYLFRYPSPEALAAAIKTLQEVRTVTPDAPDGDRDEFRI
jgi:acyl carrier protein